MAKKLKVWLNNKLNKRLRFTVVIKFFRIFITELVLTFFVFKCPNYFEFLKCGKRSPHFKILEIPGGRGGHQRPPGTENPGGWGGANQSVFRGGGMDIFWNHTMSFFLCTIFMIELLLVTINTVIKNNKNVLFSLTGRRR